VNFAPTAIGFNGGNLPHENRQPYLTLNYCVALRGIFPPRN
jgi:microcystin-dependent protein